MRVSYKILPLNPPHPAYPQESSIWVPMLSVRLSYGHSRQTPRIEAVVDSGSGDCLFQADIGKYIWIDITSGAKVEIGGVVAGPKIDAYFHDVYLWVGADRIRIKAGFSPQMAVGAILGRRGFFENFIVTFDPANDPPGLEIQRLGRA